MGISIKIGDFITAIGGREGYVEEVNGKEIVVRCTKEVSGLLETVSMNVSNVYTINGQNTRLTKLGGKVQPPVKGLGD